MWTPVKPRSGTLAFLCQRDGSNTPSNTRHTRPSPSTPVLSARSTTTEQSCFKDRWSLSARVVGIELNVFAFDWRHRRAGMGEHLGAKMKCVRCEGRRVTPARDIEPCTTVSAYVPRRDNVSSGIMTRATAKSVTKVEGSRNSVSVEESTNILLFHLGSKVDNMADIGRSSTAAFGGAVVVGVS